MRLAALALVVACTSPPPRIPETTAYARLETRWPRALEALGRLHSALRAAGDDCAQMARTLRTFASAHGTTMRQLGELHDQLDPHERERFDWDHVEERERLTGLFAMQQQCPSDASVSAAFEVAGFRSRQLRGWIE
jgi:hypothetical protein